MAPLTVLSPGPRLAGTPSKGKKRIVTIETNVAVLRRNLAADGSRWQVLGRSPSHLAPRDASTDDFLGMPEEIRFDFRNLLFDYRHVSSESAASPGSLIQQLGYRTDSRNLVQATNRRNTGPLQHILLLSVQYSRSAIFWARS